MFNQKSMTITKNRTLSFLFLGLRLYETEKDLPTELFRAGFTKVCIGDSNYDSDYTKDRLFILLKVNSYFQYVMSYVSDQDYYIDDYIYDDEHHVLVIALGEGRVNKFIAGKYSELYTQKEVDRCFSEKIRTDDIEKYNNTYSILIRRPSYKTKFKDRLNQIFNTNLSLRDIDDDAEYDIPPILKQEILNYENSI